MRLAIALAALALALPLTASGQTPMIDRPFIAELHRQCPRQHLENMTAGDLELIMEGFEEHFSPAETRQLQDAIGERCAKGEAALTGGNTASPAVFRRQNRLKAFVHAARASGGTCH